MDLLELNQLDDSHLSHWYYRNKFNCLKPYLSSVKKKDHLIDVGAGSGIFSQLFLSDTEIRSATAYDINYPENRDLTLQNSKIVSYRKELTDFSCDLILMMDILEHIEDDKDFLKGIVEKADSGTVFFITVPAFQSLFSSHDVFLKHFRRYNRRSLQSLVSGSGLKIETSFYGFYTLFFPVAALRISKRLLFGNKADSAQSEMNASPHPLLNRSLALLHAHEPLLKNPFFGLTCFCIAQK